MPLKLFLAALLGLAAAAEAPLPELRIEPTAGGSILYVRNTSPQPLTAFLIELVDYPGSSFSLCQDLTGAEAIAPRGEKRIQVANMTVGAVPEYVKIQAALYEDGSSSGIPEKVAQLIERRRFLRNQNRSLIQMVERALAGAEPKTGVIASVKRFADELSNAGKAGRYSQAALNQAAARDLLRDTIAKLQTQSLEETLASLRASERALSASKPPLD